MTLRTDQTSGTPLAGNHSADHAATNTLVNQIVADLLTKAAINNPTFTGTVTLSADPIADLQAATKHYVDSLSSAARRTASITVAPYGSTEPADFVCASATGNQVEISAAIAAANALSTGGDVYLRAGHYKVTSPIVPLSNVTLRGEGKATILQNTAGGTGIAGACIIKDVGVGFSDFGVENMTFIGNRATSSTSCSIHITGSRDINIPGSPVISNFFMRNVNIRDNSSLPIRLFGLSGKLEVSGCDFNHNADPGFGFNEEVIFVGNHSVDSSDNGFSISRGNEKVICVGNTVENPTFWGIWLSGFAGQAGPSYVACVGNVVRNSRYSCIALIGSPRNVAVCGNTLDQGHNRPQDSNVDGIQIYGGSLEDRAENITVSGNTIMNASRGGITYAWVNQLSIVGNTIINTGTQFKANGSTVIQSTDTTSNVGILWTHPSSNVWVDGNAVYDTRDTPLCNWDVWKIGTSEITYGRNHSFGMRNTRNEILITQKYDAGTTPAVQMTGPDANIGLQMNMKGSGELQVRGTVGGINIHNALAGTGQAARLRFSTGALTAYIGGLQATRNDPQDSSLVTVNILSGGVLTPSNTTAPFYVQGTRVGGAYSGFNSGMLFKRKELANINYTLLPTDYLVGYTSLSAGRTVTLPTAVQVPGQTYVVKDETGTAATNNITINPFALGSVSFTNADVDPTTDVISLTTNIVTGTPVTITTAGTMPGGLTAATTYYVSRGSLASKNAVNSSTTIVNDSAVGSIAWLNPSNAGGAGDNVYATWTGDGGFDGDTPVDSNYLKFTGLGFSIPATAVVDGVKVQVSAKATLPAGDFVSVVTVQLVKGGTVQGTNNATGANLSTIETLPTYGSTTDRWGLSLTASDVNSSNFGFVYQVNSVKGTASVDNVVVTVYYTVPNDIKLATSLGNALGGTAIDITDAGSGTFNVASPAQTIDGASSLVISSNYGSATLYSDGIGNWNTI